MHIFSTNQATHVYVAKVLKDSVTDLTASTAEVGHTVVKATPDKSAIYFQHKGAGGLTRSDLIDVKNILYAKATKAADMQRALKVSTVTLNADVNGGQPVVGQDYVLRVTFDGYIGISPEDSQYWKHAIVHVTNGMDASAFYKQMALSLAKNMSREAKKLITIELNDGTEVTARTKEATLSGTYTSLVIKEVEQDWLLGTKQIKPLNITVVPTEIMVKEGDTLHPVKWGTVVNSVGAKIKNGKDMADLEYFHMGERGDQYRMVGFPDYVPTTYLVDPTKEYDTINIHYAYVGSNESCQKSEKDIILIVPAGQTKQFVDKINELITASGVQINELA